MPHQRVTRPQIRTLLEDKYEHTPFWEAEELDLAINESFRVYNLLTGTWRKRLVFSTPKPWNHFIAVPSVLLYGTRVAWDGLPLSYSSIDDLNKIRPHWRGETTLMKGDIPRRPTVWARTGLTSFGVWPADARACGTWVVDGVADTPTLTDDVAYADLGDEELHGLLSYQIHYLSFKKGGSFLADTLPLYQNFLATCAKKNSRLKATAFYRRAMGLERGRIARPDALPSLQLPGQGQGEGA